MKCQVGFQKWKLSCNKNNKMRQLNNLLSFLGADKLTFSQGLYVMFSFPTLEQLPKILDSSFRHLKSTQQ